LIIFDGGTVMLTEYFIKTYPGYIAMAIIDLIVAFSLAISSLGYLNDYAVFKAKLKSNDSLLSTLNNDAF
jgi:hypothetical protein